MVLSSRHLTVTLIFAMLLHAGVAIWFALPEVTPPVQSKPPLQINLLATIAETTVNAVVDIIEPPPPKKLKPIIQKPIVKPKSAVKPKPVEIPVAKVKAAENIPEQVLPVEARPAPMDAVATARYEQLLIAWLEKHKNYPSRAKRLRIEGEGMLRILIDRSGQTQRVELTQRTGNRLLDKAALEMAERANPFPPMPNDDPRRKLEFMVPVAFMLR